MGRSMYGCIRWGGYRRREGAVLEVNFGRPIVSNGDFLRSCAEVRAAIELSLGEVSEVVTAWV